MQRIQNEQFINHFEIPQQEDQVLLEEVPQLAELAERHDEYESQQQNNDFQKAQQQTQITLSSVQVVVDQQDPILQKQCVKYLIMQINIWNLVMMRVIYLHFVSNIERLSLLYILRNYQQIVQQILNRTRNKIKKSQIKDFITKHLELFFENYKTMYRISLGMIRKLIRKQCDSLCNEIIWQDLENHFKKQYLRSRLVNIEEQQIDLLQKNWDNSYYDRIYTALVVGESEILPDFEELKLKCIRYHQKWRDQSLYPQNLIIKNNQFSYRSQNSYLKIGKDEFLQSLAKAHLTEDTIRSNLQNALTHAIDQYKKSLSGKIAVCVRKEFFQKLRQERQSVVNKIICGYKEQIVKNISLQKRMDDQNNFISYFTLENDSFIDFEKNSKSENSVAHMEFEENMRDFSEPQVFQKIQKQRKES